MQQPLDWQAIEPPQEGHAVTFSLNCNGIQEEGFAIRHRNELFAYINRCPHAGTSLDWLPGRFFSGDKSALVCQTHGAVFEPDSGICISGPCPKGLDALPVKTNGTSVEVPTLWSPDEKSVA